MSDTLAPGQTVRCTITKEPRAAAPARTIARLMRHDPANAKALRRAQKGRRDRMVVYTRGNRDWHQRERCGKIVRVRAGEGWTMRITPQVLPDLRCVARYLSIEGA